MTGRRRPPRTLTPATVTARYPAFRSGRVENWAARSDDGTWAYERLEQAGTPWEVTHLPTARAGTADGSALAYVELALAHGRGEHAAARVPACGRC
jgi:hypothetical protein